MLASIWLQVIGDQFAPVRSLITSLAARHGTLPFEPHLTVCGGSNLDPAHWDAAADYARHSRLLPLTAKKARISYSTSVWSRAVVIDVEDDPAIRAFREGLSSAVGAAILAPPHISLLYTIGSEGQRPSWAESETKLKAIADDCTTRLATAEFALADPVVVAPDGDWTNIRSWRVVHSL